MNQCFAFSVQNVCKRKRERKRERESVLNRKPKNLHPAFLFPLPENGGNGFAGCQHLCQIMKPSWNHLLDFGIFFTVVELPLSKLLWKPTVHDFVSDFFWNPQEIANICLPASPHEPFPNYPFLSLSLSLPPFPFRTCAKRRFFVEQWRKHGFNNWDTKISSPLAFRSAWASLAQFDDSSYASSCSTIFFFSYSVRASSFTCVQPRREEGRGKKRAPQGGFCYLGKKNVEKLVRKQRKLICSLILESFKTTVVSYVHLLAMTPRDSTTFSLMK